jgi:hypothetical protein
MRRFQSVGSTRVSVTVAGGGPPAMAPARAAFWFCLIVYTPATTRPITRTARKILNNTDNYFRE